MLQVPARGCPLQQLLLCGFLTMDAPVLLQDLHGARAKKKKDGRDLVGGTKPGDVPWCRRRTPCFRRVVDSLRRCRRWRPHRRRLPLVFSICRSVSLSVVPSVAVPSAHRFVLVVS